MRDDHKYRRGEKVLTRWGIAPKCKGGRQNHRWSKTDSAVCTACGYDVLHQAYYPDFIAPEPEPKYKVRLTETEAYLIWKKLRGYELTQEMEEKIKEIAPYFTRAALNVRISKGGKGEE